MCVCYVRAVSCFREGIGGFGMVGFWKCCCFRGLRDAVARVW